MADLTRVLYRSVLRAARLMDRHSHLKSLVVRTDELLDGNPSAQAAHQFFHKSSSAPITVQMEDPVTGEVVDISHGENEKPPEDASNAQRNPFVEAISQDTAANRLPPKQKLLNEVFSRALGGPHALYYLPPSAELSEEARREREFTNITKELFRSTKEDHLDVAFTALREMNRCIALGKLLRKQDKLERESAKQRPAIVKRLRKRLLELAKEQKANQGSEKPSYGQPVSTLEPGVVLIAHPLQTGYFGQTVILLDKYDKDNGAEGIILNKPTPYVTKQILPEEEGSGYLDFFGFDKRALFDGGPVPPSAGAVVSLHRYGLPGSTSEVIPGVYRGLSLQQGPNGPWLNTGVVPLASSLSSEPEHCARLLREAAPDEESVNIHVTSSPADNAGSLIVGKKAELKIFWGKAVWIKGQLENELRLGSWLLGKLDKDVILESLQSSDRLSGSDCNQVMTTYWQGALRLLGSPFAEMRKLQRVCSAPPAETEPREIRIVAL